MDTNTSRQERLRAIFDRLRHSTDAAIRRQREFARVLAETRRHLDGYRRARQTGSVLFPLASWER